MIRNENKRIEMMPTTMQRIGPKETHVCKVRSVYKKTQVKNNQANQGKENKLSAPTEFESLNAL